MYSVFSALGLKVGIHPIVSNEERGEGLSSEMRMGGMSWFELMRAKTRDHDGDPVELFLDDLKRDARIREDAEREDAEADNCYHHATEIAYYEHPDPFTIVGTRLHGPTFDEEEDENMNKV